MGAYGYADLRASCCGSSAPPGVPGIAFPLMLTVSVAHRSVSLTLPLRKPQTLRGDPESPRTTGMSPEYEQIVGPSGHAADS